MSLEIRFYDPDKVSKTTRNRLPHWEQAGATYFLTFRLADAVPAELLAAYVREKRDWVIAHPGPPWSGEDEKEYHRRFSHRFERWLDRGDGSCLLKARENAAIVADALQHFEGERSMLHSWVIMPNHVHVLFSLSNDQALGSLMHSWKGFSAREINRRSGAAGSIWQKSYFDRIIRDWDHFANCARYIRNNPAKAKLAVGEFLQDESDFVRNLLGAPAGVAAGVAASGPP
jgi:REP element-mobilizing transposase RayT